MTVETAPVRVERVRARASARRRDPSRPTRAVERLDPELGDECAVAIDLGSPPAPSRLAERWTRLRELWAQTTFYLFDGDGWRR